MTPGVALFGGSFNPIHMGHLIAARAVAEHLRLSRVVLIPSANPPHKLGHEDLVDAAHRLQMTSLAVEGDRMFEVSDVEIRRTGPSYTILTVEHYRSMLPPETRLYWIIGGDSLPELASWYRVRELVELCHIVTAVRPGYDCPDLEPLAAVLTQEQVERLKQGVLPTPRIDLSATEIRRRVRDNLPIRYMVAEPVEAYIREHRLYCGAR